MPLFFSPPPASDISVSLLCGFGDLDEIADSFDPFIGSVTMLDFLGLSPATGVIEFCLGVPAPLACAEAWCFFLCFLRVDSLPLVSDADM